MNRIIGLLAIFSLSVLLTACGGGSGGSGGSDSSAEAVITLLSPASATAPFSGNVAVQLDGSESFSDAEIQSYLWALVKVPAESSASLSASDTVTTEFTADAVGDYVVSLVITDINGHNEETRFTYKATDPRPVAVADTVVNVSLGTSTVGLNGSASRLPEGETSGELTYQWQLISQPDGSAAGLLNSSAENATLYLDVAGEYALQLVVSYNGYNSEPLDVLVTVFVDNAQPVAKAGDVSSIMGNKVTLDASASYDADGDDLEYRWRISDGPFEPFPQLNNATTATADFTPEIAGEYELVLFVFDGQRASEEVTVTVTVTADPQAGTNLAPVGELVATGYSPSKSFGEQELGLRAEFNFVGYDPEGNDLSVVSAELLEKPDGSQAELVNIGSWKPLGKKIQKLDVEGTYRVRMTVTDGEQQTTSEATMVAKIGGVNNYPTTNLDVDAKAVLVGTPLIFNASTNDQDGDPLTYEWTLIDKPDGSNATIEAVIHPENGDYSRARVLTDLPGVYRAKLRVRDDRGLYDPNPEEEFGYAKLENKVPQILGVVWTRNWGLLSLAEKENFYQLLPCMALLHRPVVVDPDGDDVFTHNEMISTPDGGAYTSYPDQADCPDSRGTVFTKPGQYIIRYYATDVIYDAPDYDFIVDIEPMSDARGVLLRNLSSRGNALHPLPYESKPPYGYVFSPTSKPITSESAYAWSLEAMDGNYTIENVQATHINGGLVSLTPYFNGLQEGTVIQQGETLEFRTVMPAIPCRRTDDAYEGFHFSFNIKEIPEITFTFEEWLGESSFSSTWQDCEPGQLD